jgi:hypothetical protein
VGNQLVVGTHDKTSAVDNKKPRQARPAGVDSLPEGQRLPKSKGWLKQIECARGSGVTLLRQPRHCAIEIFAIHWRGFSALSAKNSTTFR